MASIRLVTRRLLANTQHSRTFHVSSKTCVKVGDKIPDFELVEGSPGNKVNLSSELTGRGVIIGVPAAFSKTLLSIRS